MSLFNRLLHSRGPASGGPAGGGPAGGGPAGGGPAEGGPAEGVTSSEPGASLPIRVHDQPKASDQSGGHERRLRGALIESRQRWRDLVEMAADFAFETDREGRFVFIAPDEPMGWTAARLIGEPASNLLPDLGGASGFNPFKPASEVRRRRGWLKRADGSLACLTFAAAPLHDESGMIVGARGVGQDTTVQDSHDSAVAATLRRGEVLDHILWHVRQEVLAPRMMAATLDALLRAMGAEGAAVVDVRPGEVMPQLLHEKGTGGQSVLQSCQLALAQEGSEPVCERARDGRPVLVCPSYTRFGDRAALALWRAPEARDWDDEDLLLASSATGLIRMILEHESIQREMARQARTDPLTGLLNRRAFIEELSRRLERLDREELPGTLVFIDLDHFKALNDLRGHEAGDEALRVATALLRNTFRPTDLVARFGGDEFAVWLDGGDQFVAAERAEQLRLSAPTHFADVAMGLAQPLTMSIGIAMRQPFAHEEIESLLRRADRAMYEVKRAGRGHWRASQEEPT